jgi:hypothetical protein
MRGVLLRKFRMATPGINDTRNRLLPVSLIAGREQIFDNEYLREFEAKIEKVSVSV